MTRPCSNSMEISSNSPSRQRTCPIAKSWRLWCASLETDSDSTPAPEEERSLPDSLCRLEALARHCRCLAQLKSRFRLAILSNIDDDLFAATRPQLGVEFDEIVTAQQAQAYKPSRKIFELMMSRFNATPDRILHVGQSIYHDVIPAQSLGTPTVWVNRPSHVLVSEP